jgi:hypothetical protein
MPILPLYNPAAPPGAWHDVTAPGGYECWAFDGEDPAADIQVTVVFASGAPLDTQYLREFAQYKRSPTKRLPPLPRDHAGVALCVYRGGRRLEQSFETGAMAVHDGELTIGRSRMSRVGDTWRVSAGGAELTFSEAVLPPVTRPVLRFLRRSQHEWTAVAPRCRMAGRAAVAGGAIDLAGIGSHEYALGTAPICYGVNRLVRGRLFTADGVAMFHLAQHATDPGCREALLRHVTPAGVTELPGADVDSPRFEQIRFGDLLTLRNGRIIAAYARGLRMAFDAEWQGKGAGVAFADAIFPQPPRQPIKTAAMEWLLAGD